MALEWKFVADLQGVQGDEGKRGPQGLHASGSLPQMEAVAEWIRTEGTSPVQEALDARYADLPAFNLIRPTGRVETVGDGELFANLRKWAFANGTDDTNAIQDCLNTVNAAGGGTVLAPTGDYTHVQTRMMEWTRIKGHGYRTRFMRKAKSPEGMHQFVLDNSSVEFTGLESITIHGQASAQDYDADGINYDNAGGSFSFYDPNHRISNVVVYLTRGNGVVTASSCRHTMLDDVRTQGVTGVGFDLSATDAEGVKLVAAESGKTGIILRGTNGRWTMLKSFGSGKRGIEGDRNGIYIRGARNTISTAEAQDNDGHGFLIVAPFTSLEGAIADSNGKGVYGEGFHFDGAPNMLFSGQAFDRQGLASRTQQRGAGFVGSLPNFDGRLSSADNVAGHITGTPTSGRLVVNGVSVFQSA
jgi:hypothetical protein